MAELRIGTCSWRYPSWAGLVYSAPKGINYLREYSQAYDTVEIDRWFWSLFGETSIGLPDPADVQRYRDSVPDHFSFTIKAPNSITLTHFYKKRKSDPLVENPTFFSPSLFGQFLSLLEPLGGTLGPVMFQFGYLNKQMVDSQDQFQGLLGAFAEEIPREYAYAVEVRNARYLNRPFFEFLLEHRLHPVLLQGYWMPSIDQVYEEWGDLIAEHATVVIRLLGPDRKGIEKETGKRWDRVVAPKDEELSAIVEMTKDLVNRGVTVYLNVNNHYEGSAPMTIERIRSRLTTY